MNKRVFNYAFLLTIILDTNALSSVVLMTCTWLNVMHVGPNEYKYLFPTVQFKPNNDIYKTRSNEMICLQWFGRGV